MLKSLLQKLLVVLLCFISGIVIAQERTVTGKVTSAETGEVLPGVNVVIKGTSTGAVTDIDGNYILSVPNDGATLIFSFIGLSSQEIAIGARSVVDVQMVTDVQQLSEVVVTGYAEQDVRALTGSVVQVEGDKFQQIPVGDVSRLLQGNVAGLQAFGSQGAPGASTQVRIRGIGSALASAEPLYVIDGIPIQTQDLDPSRSAASTSTGNPLNSINPNDIESVVVLKDASSTAIYGSRGSNGVILITTKSGKAGKTNVNVRAQYGISDRAYYGFKNLNAQQYVTLRAESYLNANPGASIESAYAYAGSDSIDTDWNDIIYRQGITQSYDVSTSGGNEKTTFFVSGSYFDQEGIVIRTDLKRFTSRVNLDHNISDKWRVGINLTGSYTQRDPVTNSSTFNNPVLQAILLDPNAPIYNEDGSYFIDFNSILGGNDFNPVAIDELDTRYENMLRTIGKVYASYEIIPNLSFRSDLAFDLMDEEQLVHQNTTYGDGGSVTGRTSTYEQRNAIWQTTNTLSYNNTFADLHNVTGIAVFEALSRDWYDNATGITNFANDDLVRPSNGSVLETIVGNGSESSLVSYLGILRYDYGGRYFVSTSFRRDGSSRFGSDVKYGDFWSFGGAWLISEESFLANAGWINALKLRASYGQTGNENLLSATNQGDFRSLALYNAFATYNGNPGFAPAQIANPELTWEVKEKFNVGLDYSFLRTRIGGTVDYYIETTSDLIFGVPVSRTTGFASVTTNAASMQNRGIEFSLNTVNVDGQNFSWRTNFNIAFNENEVLDLGGEAELIDGTKKRTVGHDWSEFYLAPYAGVDPGTGKPLWYDTEGNITDSYNANNRIMTGKNATPDYFGGITNTITFGGFDLSALVYFSVGSYIYNNWSFVYESNGGFMGENSSVTQLDRWQQPGDLARFPKRGLGSDPRAGATDDGDLWRADFVRLRNLQLGYSLPDNLLNKVNIPNARIYVQGTNLLTFSTYKGMDPEQQVSGVEDFTYPPARTITVGLDLSF